MAAAIGPQIKVMGANTHPKRGPSVFCAKFTPAGANMALLKNGFKPWTRAWDAQPRNQMNKVESPTV
jgi:hypothetical protein